MLNDGRSNNEVLLSVGAVQEDNLSNCLLFPATLLAADKYYSLKQQVLESFGFGPSEQFPVYADRFPLQLLAYLRLSRIQDPGLLAKVSCKNLGMRIMLGLSVICSGSRGFCPA